MKKSLLRFLRLAAFSYLGIVIFLALAQRQLLYHPTRSSQAALLPVAAVDHLAPWHRANGELIGWQRPHPQATHRLLVFQGNAGYALHRAFYADAFASVPGPASWEVFLQEYPGYGARVGAPTKDSLVAAGRAAIEELLTADPRPLVLLGESLGSGVASILAGEFGDRLAGLILVTPFARLSEVAQGHFPILPAAWILRDRFDNLAALASYRGPTVVVIAEQDEVVGADQGRKLHAALTAPKHLIVLPGAHHNDLPTAPDAPWFREAEAHVRERTPR